MENRVGVLSPNMSHPERFALIYCAALSVPVDPSSLSLNVVCLHDVFQMELISFR